MHEHQFIKTSDIDKAKNNTPIASDKIFGAVVVCAICGVVRKIWEDGTIETTWPQT